jgi:hypothetical protein
MVFSLCSIFDADQQGLVDGAGFGASGRSNGYTVSVITDGTDADRVAVVTRAIDVQKVGVIPRRVCG